jgi:hypothetical protein
VTTSFPDQGGAWDGDCQACGSLEDQHHSDERCDTTAERVSRLRFSGDTGRWPGSGEGCGGGEKDGRDAHE